MNNRGSMLVLFIPALVGIFTLTLLVMRWEHAQWAAGKAQVVAEETLWSSLRVKAEGLGQIAGKWEPLRPLCGSALSDAVLMDSSLWTTALKAAQSFKNSIPGYKGRIKSVSTVLLEANGMQKGILSSSGAALDLGVVSKGQWLQDPSGARVWADGLWVQRTWSPSQRLGQPEETAVHEVTLTDPYFGPVKARAQARVRWDAALKNPSVKTFGNGGIPRYWDDAIQSGWVDPFRYPYYRTEALSAGLSHE